MAPQTSMKREALSFSQPMYNQIQHRPTAHPAPPPPPKKKKKNQLVNTSLFEGSSVGLFLVIYGGSAQICQQKN